MRRMVVPSGDVHEASPDELFFSLTDAKGVIQHTNPVFNELSRMSAKELLGSPHNLVRHPEMPGGLFRLIWDMLEAGLPTCAYIKNLAADGSAYWAFATIVPVGQGYLSVRCRPNDRIGDHETRPLFTARYQEIRRQEMRLRGRGFSPRECAGQGANLVEDSLLDFGFESYVDFMLTALPAEVATRQRDLAPDASALTVRMRRLAGDLREHVAVSRRLGESIENTRATVTDLHRLLVSNADQVSAAARRTPAISGSLQGIIAAAEGVLSGYATLDENLGELHLRRRELAFSLALLQLQVELVEQEAGRVNGVDLTEASLLDGLCDVITAGFERLDDDLRWNETLGGQAGQAITALGDPLNQMLSLLANWRLMTVRAGVASDLADLLTEIDAVLERAKRTSSVLTGTGAELSALRIPFAADRASKELKDLRSSARVNALLEPLAE